MCEKKKDLELRDFLVSLADRVTKDPSLQGMRGRKILKSTSKGLLITVPMTLEDFKRSDLCSEERINVVLDALSKEFFPDVGVTCDLEFVYFSRILSPDEAAAFGHLPPWP